MNDGEYYDEPTPEEDAFFEQQICGDSACDGRCFRDNCILVRLALGWPLVSDDPLEVEPQGKVDDGIAWLGTEQGRDWQYALRGVIAVNPWCDIAEPYVLFHLNGRYDDNQRENMLGFNEAELPPCPWTREPTGAT